MMIDEYTRGCLGHQLRGAPPLGCVRASAPGSCWNMTARTTSARSTASNCQMLLDRPVMIRRLPSVRSRLSE